MSVKKDAKEPESELDQLRRSNGQLLVETANAYKQAATHATELLRLKATAPTREEYDELFKNFNIFVSKVLALENKIFPPAPTPSNGPSSNNAPQPSSQRQTPFVEEHK